MSSTLGIHITSMPAPDRTTPRLVAAPPAGRYGAVPGFTVAEVLANLPAEWHALDALDGRVAVGPGGVFVIRVVRADGELRVENEVLRVGGRARARVVAAAKDGARAVLTSVPLVLPEDVQPFVCLESDQPFVGQVRGVTVCTTATLRQTMEAFPEVFAPEHSELITLFIRNGMMHAASDIGRHAGPKSRRPRRKGAAGLHAVR